jgi:hypothetical protein
LALNACGVRLLPEATPTPVTVPTREGSWTPTHEVSPTVTRLPPTATKRPATSMPTNTPESGVNINVLTSIPQSAAELADGRHCVTVPNPLTDLAGFQRAWRTIESVATNKILPYWSGPRINYDDPSVTNTSTVTTGVNIRAPTRLQPAVCAQFKEGAQAAVVLGFVVRKAGVDYLQPVVTDPTFKPDVDTGTMVVSAEGILKNMPHGGIPANGLVNFGTAIATSGPTVGMETQFAKDLLGIPAFQGSGNDLRACARENKSCGSGKVMIFSAMQGWPMKK